MSSPIDSLISRYNPKTVQDFENALKEIIQEITLAGLARANFFDKAAFYGGTALRIFYGLPRFSEDLDFTLLHKQSDFSLSHYFNSVQGTLNAFNFDVEFEEINKKNSTDIESAFLKANTKIHLLKIKSAQKFASSVQNNKQNNKKLSIKFEVDTNPPLGFDTEVKVLLPPITSAVKVLTPSSLFAGKMHAILFRQWKNRVKGRDFYDLLWYLGQGHSLNLRYLETKMRDSGNWDGQHSLSRTDLLELLKNRIATIDFKSAAQDVTAFINDPREVDSWNQEFFLSAIQKIKVD